MPYAREVAVVLRVSPFGETSQVATLLTRGLGRLKVLAKGARRTTKAGKGRFDGGLDVLDLGDAMFVHAPEKNLPPLAEWKLLDRHRLLRGDLRALWLGRYAAELVDRLLEEHDPHPKLFDGLLRLMDRLSDATIREAVFLAFTLNLMRQVGVLPDFARCRDRTPVEAALRDGLRLGFDVEAARLVCGDEVIEQPDVLPVEPAAVRILVRLLRLAKAGGELPRITQDQAVAAHRLLAAHMRHQTGGPLRMTRYVLATPASSKNGSSTTLPAA
jgi:DNA repair protein RecO